MYVSMFNVFTQKDKKSKICTNTCTKKTHSLKIEFWPEPVFFVNFNVKHPVFLIKGGRGT